jgi:hypothetical protein
VKIHDDSLSKLTQKRPPFIFSFMKPRRIMLLLSLAGVVVMGFFLLAELLTPNESPENLARDLTQGEKRSDSLPKPVATSGRTGTVQSTKLSTGRIPEPDLALQQREEDEEDLAQEQAEAEEEAREQTEEDAEDEEEEALKPEEEESLNEFLSQITPENWRQARAELLSAYKDGTLPRNPFVEDKFWSKVGEIGGKDLANELLSKSDPAFSKILKGWGKTNPQELFDFLWDLAITDPKIQKYLEKTNDREFPFMDQLSNSLIEGIIHADDSKTITDSHVGQISKTIDLLMEKDPYKADSLMREFSKRVVTDQTPEALKDWVTHYDKPNLQAAAAGKVIESGTFDKDPLAATEFALSLEKDQPRRTALSAAYARLASGVNGHDPSVTAVQLDEMDKGADRDFALNGFAHGLVHKDPDAALEWANEISNENFRKVVTKNISRRIQKERPKAQAVE